MLSSAIKQQEGFADLATCLLLEADNLAENGLTVLRDQGMFYSSLPNESLSYF